MKKIFTLCLLVQTAFTVSAQTTFRNELQSYNGSNAAVNGKITSNNIENASAVQAQQNVSNAGITYCTPTHTKNDKDNLITRVDFVGTLNDVTNSSNSNVGYENFTGLTSVAKQEQGEAVNLNIYLYANGLFNAWVDWNQDGDFNDAGEQVYSTNGIFTNSTTFGFQIPITQATGSYRIRIRTANYYYYNGPHGPYYADNYTNSNITPCGNLNDGQAEDYVFTVVSRCYARISSFSNATKCSNTSTSFNLTATGTSVTTAVKWYSAETGGSLLATTPASAANHTASFTTPALSSTTTYWVTATNGTCESSARVAVVADKRPVPTITFTPASPTRICDGDGLNVGGKSSTETAYLINEGFESGLGTEFKVTTTNNTTTDQPWQIRTSVFTPTSTAVWRPAISSGFGANKFLSALGNAVSSNTMVSTLTSSAHNTNTFTNLILKFKLFYDHYLTDNSSTAQDNITVQAFDGSKWNTLQQSGADLGIASKMVTLTYNLSSSYLNKSNVQVRFVYNAELNLSDGVAIDSIQLYGDRPASNSYIWTQIGGITGNCLYTDSTETVPYISGVTASQLYIKPTDDQQEDGTPLSFETKLIASNGCTALDTMVINIDDKVWTGSKSTDWNLKTNWCGNKVPVISDRVGIQILSSGGNYPVIHLGGTGRSRFLTIDSGANLTIDSGAVMMIRRDLLTQVGATFTNNGTLTMQGTENGAVQNFPGPGTIAEMNNLIINYTAKGTGDTNNVLLNAPISIRGQLSSSSGKLSLNDNDVTIKSYASATGYVSAMGNTAGFIYNGSGRFIIERFIPGRRAWRFLSAPLDSALSTQTINQSWQEGKTNTTLDCSSNQYTAPGYGTDITYNGANGFDANITYNPSIKVWVNNLWTYPSSTNIPLNTYSAYCLFVRGDRTICLSSGVYAPPTNTVLRARGVLNEPINGNGFSKMFSGTPGSFVFAGNPYASPLDLTNVLKSDRSSGIESNKFWTWNPRANGASGVGGYIAFSNGVRVPSSGMDSTYTAGTIVQSGQAFMVQLSSNSSSANINFQQSDKAATQSNVFGKEVQSVQPPTYSTIYTNLLIPANTLTLTDGVGAVFGNQFSSAVDNDDAFKLWNFDENISLYRDTKYLAIEFRPVPLIKDTLFYRLYLRQQPYTLQIFAQNLQSNFPSKAWLVDNYLHTQTEVNLKDTTLYNFTPNPDTLSYRNRFMLVFNRQAVANPVPVSKVVNQDSPTTSGITNSIANKTKGISIYPDPVKPGNNVNVIVHGIADGIYKTEITDVNGKKIITGKLTYEKGNSNYPVLLPSNVKPGVYDLQLINAAGILTATEKLIVAN